MERSFGRRQREDQPTVTRIDGLETENIAEEGAVGVGVLGVNDDVGT